MERGEHNIEDELVFANHRGYAFHDSRGFEAGSEDELKTVQDFVRRKSQERRLGDRLHAIWYCIPMDNDRPELEVKHFHDICPDRNVPVIAVFTKYDQFERDTKYKLEDRPEGLDQGTDLNDEVERIFREHYQAYLEGSPLFVCLGRMHKPGEKCTTLIEMTADALSPNVVALMLVAAQKNGLELSIQQAVKRAHSVVERGGSINQVVKECILAFPSLWHLSFFERRTKF